MTDYTDGDLLKALQFLDGRLDGLGKLHRDWSPAEENEHREALAKVLKSENPARVLLDRLAGMFAPDCPDAAPSTLVVKGRRRNAHRPRQMVHIYYVITQVEMWRSKGLSVEDSIESAARNLGMTFSAVRSVYDRNRDLHQPIKAVFHPHK